MDAVMPYTIQANFNHENNREFPFEWLCRVAGCTHHDVNGTREGAERVAARHAVTHTETELASTGHVVRVNYAALATSTTPEEVTEYSVKIWYKSDTYEGVSHCPEELARKIYADAAASNGVEFAELHGPSGKLVESRGPGLD